MPDRRFDDEEIQEILTRATEVRDRAPSLPDSRRPVDGAGQSLTLVELQEVAAEVGIPPARLAEAAATLELDRAALPPAKTSLGLPISAAHVVRLPRMLEPDEWDRFVVRLRDTFNAAGTVRTEGSLRTWSNGHLEVLLEPLDEGARLRFQSLDSVSKGYLEAGASLGFGGIAMAVFFGILAPVTGKSMPWALLGFAGSLPALGAWLWAMGRSKTRRWLPERRAQFLALGKEAVEVVDRPPREKNES